MGRRKKGTSKDTNNGIDNNFDNSGDLTSGNRGDSIIDNSEEVEHAGFNNALCLVCGSLDFEEGNRSLINLNDIVIKVEVTGDECEEEEQLGLMRNDGGAGDTYEGRKDNNVHASVSSSSKKWSEDETLVYQWFVQLFQLKLEAVRKKKSKGGDLDLGWNGDIGKDSFPFCWQCKEHLMELFELHKMVEELQEKIEEGVNNLRGKMASSEDTFKLNGIYDKNQRYKRVREQIASKFKKGLGSSSGYKSSKHIGKGSGKSTRNKTTVMQPDLDESEGSNSPLEATSFDTFSSSDITSTELRLITKLKSEILNDDDHDNQKLNTELNDEVSTLPAINRRSKRTRKSRLHKSLGKQTDDEQKELSLYLDNDLSDNNDSDSPDSPIKKQQQKRKKRDTDWVPEESSKAGGDSEVSEEDDVGDEDHYNHVTGKRMRHKIVVDTEKRTITYAGILFHHLEPFENNKYQCTDCGDELTFKTSQSTGLRAHYVSKHTDLYACKNCDFRGSSKGRLSYHIKTVHEGARRRPQNIVICKYCGRPTNLSALRGHEFSHKNEQEKAEAIARQDKDLPYYNKVVYQCDVCGHKTGTKYSLRRHTETIHGKGVEMQLCPTCGGTFKHLKAHQRQVHGIDRKSTYKCLEPGCGKEFKQLARLTSHKDAVHRKIREHKCTLCPRTFSSLRYLQCHLDLHQGIRPWKCEYCPNAFGRKSNLTRHVETYHSEGSAPRRKTFARGPTTLSTEQSSKHLKNTGMYLPPSALATWAAGREPTSHFPLNYTATASSSSTCHSTDASYQ